MSSTGSAMIAMQNMSRSELCELFCKRLDDITLQISVDAGFDALLLFAQREMALQVIAAHKLPYPLAEIGDPKGPH